ncbi:MAG: DUF5411 family protein [Bacilli bacterium]|nr:DUF5411 family protein [Bacilli bacterium]MDD4809212.1 DUF5411 family protein [Bacilli bacterium]
MKESFWAVLVVSIGIIAILFVYLFQTITNTDEHNMVLLRETTEGAMYDAFDLAAYRRSGVIRIDREKFVENFIRRFAENASLARTYVIEIYDVNEMPPKVSLKVSSSEEGNVVNQVMNFDIVNRINAILEAPHSY